jgi:class 3 adenylate cyclase
MLLKELGARIRAQREKRRLKQQDVANALNISPQAVSKWERGENAPDIMVLEPLARLLGVTTDWLLAEHEPRDVFEATVLVSSVSGAYRKSLAMGAREFATWANGLFYSLTEITLHHGGVPIKYMGDQYLCFFSGADHRSRALDTALEARAALGDNLKIGLSTGDIYLGAIGHPDYARPDIMGDVVNIAFLTLQWAEANATRGIAASAATTDGQAGKLKLGRGEEVKFRDTEYQVTLIEVL